jgi:phosphopantetheinyl transferase (holo-ACP synthase)
MVDWIDDTGKSAVRMPVVMIGTRDRRLLLSDLAARALGRPVPIRHREGFAPRLPTDDVRVSCAARPGLSAAAIARAPVGVDVEAVDGGEVPLTMLHPEEAQALAMLARADRPAAFARLWAVKEAYLKALRLGLSREPATFRVTLEADGARVEDPNLSVTAQAETRWVEGEGRRYAVAVVVLPSPPIPLARGKGPLTPPGAR